MIGWISGTEGMAQVSVFVDEMFIGVHVEVIRDISPEPEARMQRVRSMLGINEVYGGSISEELGELWSSFRLDADGFLRLLITDNGLPEPRLSRQQRYLIER